jgi:hypothetical protein
MSVTPVVQVVWSSFQRLEFATKLSRPDLSLFVYSVPLTRPTSPTAALSHCMTSLLPATNNDVVVAVDGDEEQLVPTVFDASTQHSYDAPETRLVTVAVWVPLGTLGTVALGEELHVV